VAAWPIIRDGCDRDWVVEMVACGDWNCAHAEYEPLAMVARSLAMAISGRFALDLIAIARLALVDFDEARRRWARLSRRIRAALGV
jgi:hypothetical protein